MSLEVPLIIVPKRTNYVVAEQKDRTVVIPSGSNDNDIAEIIGSIKKCLDGCIITIQFEDGIYNNLNQQIKINGFYGNGFLSIQGNDSDTSCQLDKNVTLTKDGSDGASIITIGNCSLSKGIYVRYIRFTFNDPAYDYTGSLSISRCYNLVSVDYCSFDINVTDKGNAISYWDSPGGYVFNSYFKMGYAGVYIIQTCGGTTVFDGWYGHHNQSDSSRPKYGVHLRFGGRFVRTGSPYIQGSSGDYTAYGGQVLGFT